jgi:hypothetical protein
VRRRAAQNAPHRGLTPGSNAVIGVHGLADGDARRGGTPWVPSNTQAMFTGMGSPMRAYSCVWSGSVDREA